MRRDSSILPSLFLPQSFGPSVDSSPIPVEQSAPPTPKVILLAEDIDDFRAIFAMSLARKGHRVCTAADGQEAIALAKEVRPDIALLNYLMPVMNGITACGILNSMPSFDGPPIVVYSGCSIQSFRPPALEAGAWACWQTPMELSTFERRINEVLCGRGLDPERRSRKIGW